MTLTLDDTHCRCGSPQTFLPSEELMTISKFPLCARRDTEHRKVWCWSSQLYQAKGHEPSETAQRRQMHSYIESCLQCRASHPLSPGRVSTMMICKLLWTRRSVELWCLSLHRLWLLKTRTIWCHLQPFPEVGLILTWPALLLSHALTKTTRLP